MKGQLSVHMHIVIWTIHIYRKQFYPKIHKYQLIGKKLKHGSRIKVSSYRCWSWEWYRSSEDREMSMLCLYTYMNLNVFQLSDSSSSTLVQTLREPVTQPWPYSTSCVQLPSKFRLRYVYVLHSASIDDLCIRLLIISDIKNDIEHQHLFNVFKDLLSFQGIFKD